MTGRRTLAMVVALLTMGLAAGCGDEVGSDEVGSGAAVDEASLSTSSAPSSPSPTPLPSPSAARTVVVYPVGDGPRGPVLYREVRSVQEPDHGPAESIGLLTAQPLDPDYRTAWPPGAFLGGRVNLDDGTIDVLLADTTLLARPLTMSEAEAEASIQQVVYTLQAYAGQALPVRFLLGDRPVDTVLGVPTSVPVAATSALSTLSLMSLTTPAEGQVVSASFRAAGFNNGFEGTASWRVLDHGDVVAQGAAIGGWMEDRLFPWHDHVDVSGLAPGTYTFLASNDDPTGGTEGGGPDTDTRTIVVE